MDVQNLSPVLPVDDVAAAAKVWSVLLGCEPKFVDADRWALFEIGEAASPWPGPTATPISPG